MCVYVMCMAIIQEQQHLDFTLTISLSKSASHLLKISRIIQASVLLTYVTSMNSASAKPRGFFALPIANRFHLSVLSMFEHISTGIQFLPLFSLRYLSVLAASIFSGNSKSVEKTFNGVMGMPGRGVATIFIATKREQPLCVVPALTFF